MTHRRSTQLGFSLLEISATLAIMIVVLGFALLNTQGILQSFKVNSAMDQIIGQLSAARQIAISSRRNVEVAFTTPNQLQLDPETTTNVAVSPSPYPLVTLGYGTNYIQFPGIPDTPMAFGNSSAVSFSVGGGAAPLLPLKFTTTGALIDANNNFVNGTVFVGIPGQPSTARAVTILGGTGRVRAYYWTGNSWNE
jgi:Tfp pilus assembly protein FimT